MTWGVNPGQSIGVHDRAGTRRGQRSGAVADALSYMGLTAGQPIEGMKVDVAFIGSHQRTPLGSPRGGAHRQGQARGEARQGARRAGVRRRRESGGARGTGRGVSSRGFEWRNAGCSMCLGMNPDKLEGDQVCAASSNRNFKGGREVDGPHAAHEPGHGRRGRRGRRSDGRKGTGLMKCITKVTGRAIPMRGNDIDTDRIILARFLRAITFDGMEAHLFEDDRKIGGPGHNRHPFDVPAHSGCVDPAGRSQLGCGSSREHAPQAIRRWGIEAILGESSAEIFFGNSAMIGMPCVTASGADVKALQELVERNPRTEIRIDLIEGTCCR